jgi:hypothetical protein
LKPAHTRSLGPTRSDSRLAFLADCPKECLLHPLPTQGRFGGLGAVRRAVKPAHTRSLGPTKPEVDIGKLGLPPPPTQPSTKQRPEPHSPAESAQFREADQMCFKTQNSLFTRCDVVGTWSRDTNYLLLLIPIPILILILRKIHFFLGFTR